MKAVGVKIYTQNTNTKDSFLVYHTKNAKSKSEWVGTNIRCYSVFDKIISFSLVWDELSTIHFVEQVQNKSQFFNISYILQLKAIFNTVPLNFIVTLILKSIFFTK